MKVETLRSTPEPEKLAFQAARNDYSPDSLLSQSYEEAMSGATGDTLDEQEQNLTEKLMDSGHWGPYEHPQITLYLEGVSRVAMAQITRHRHASFDVQSLRYTGQQLQSIPEATDLREYFFQPPTIPDSPGRVDESNIDDFKKTEAYWSAVKETLQAYNYLVEEDVRYEDARYALPLATKINIVMSINARTAMHVLTLRMKGNAQKEARDVSKALARECKEWMPRTFDHFINEIKPHQSMPMP